LSINIGFRTGVVVCEVLNPEGLKVWYIIQQVIVV
jgi:hypothetical protein